jgi:hypothetical protein
MSSRDERCRHDTAPTTPEAIFTRRGWCATTNTTVYKTSPPALRLLHYSFSENRACRRQAMRAMRQRQRERRMKFFFRLAVEFFFQ